MLADLSLSHDCEGIIMLPEKYADLGFEITPFGIKSMVLRYNGHPVFVFSTRFHPGVAFLKRICDKYLKNPRNKTLHRGIIYIFITPMTPPLFLKRNY